MNVYPEPLPRYVDDFLCPSCKGICESVQATPEEYKAVGCGRNYACCTLVGVCTECGMRWVADLEAPEFDVDYME